MARTEPPEPPARLDGLCIVCLKPRKLPTTRYIDRAVYEAEPFCSSKCARRYFGTELPPAAPGGRKAA